MSEFSLIYAAGMPPSAPQRRPQRAAALPPDERRQAIVDAVVPLLLEHGPGVTTRQIAEAAGVAEGTLFRVFEDKPALLHAAAHAVLDPEKNRRALACIDPSLSLAAMVRAVAQQQLDSTVRTMAVLMAVRSTSDAPERSRHGPPAFVREAHRALHEGLTALFGRYSAQLRIEPERAALALRALILGSRQPWSDPASALTAAEIADLLLTGICASATDEP